MTELVVLCGTEHDGVEQTITRMRELDAGLVVLHHDLHDLSCGRVHRRLRDGERDERTVLELAHGCVSCTLREDVLPPLAALAGTVRRVVLHLDVRLEPEPVCWALGSVLFDPGEGREPCPATDLVNLAGVVTVLDPHTWLTDATGDATLPERGLSTLSDDERTVAQLAVGQAEFADVIVMTRPPGAVEDDRTAAVLDRLAPTAPRLHLARGDHPLFCEGLPPQARRGVPSGVHDPLLRGTRCSADRRRRCRCRGLGGQRGLHDHPRPPARRDPHARHRGQDRMTRICAPSPAITRSAAPAAGCRRRSTSSSTVTAGRWWSFSDRARAGTLRCSST